MPLSNHCSAWPGVEFQRDGEGVEADLRVYNGNFLLYG
jgi:hypothetical protein